MKTVNKDKVCDEFITSIDEIKKYVEKSKELFSENKLFLSFNYENAIIMLYRSFERFALRIMISCLNHNHHVFEEKNNIKLGSHINDDICEFLITKGGYFDFKGRDGLCKILSTTIGADHKLAKVFKKTAYKDSIEQLCTIRNYAAHNSEQSKKAAAKAFGLKRISSAGSCLKKNSRFEATASKLIDLANDIKNTSME